MLAVRPAIRRGENFTCIFLVFAALVDLELDAKIKIARTVEYRLGLVVV